MRHVLAALAVLMLMSGCQADAHDWYPWECCSGIDCAPVERVEALPELALKVTTSQGTVAVPASFPRRESQDNRMHVCMRPSEGGGMRVLCVFVPPSS